MLLFLVELIKKLASDFRAVKAELEESRVDVDSIHKTLKDVLGVNTWKHVNSFSIIIAQSFVTFNSNPDCVLWNVIIKILTTTTKTMPPFRKSIVRSK